MADVRGTDLDGTVRQFRGFEDPRSTVNRRHHLAGVLVIALLAVIAGAGGPTTIAAWVATKRDTLAGVLGLPHGVPGKDVFRRVLMTLQPAAFRACFAGWSMSLRDAAATATGVDRPVFAVDGKTARRSCDRCAAAQSKHMVSA